MAERRCSTCIYSHPTDGGYQCRLNPPTVVEVGSPYDRLQLLSLWPTVNDSDWCGQWSDDVNRLDNRRA